MSARSLDVLDLDDELFEREQAELFGRYEPEGFNPDDESLEDLGTLESCVDCGEYGRCGTDLEGRPLFHHPDEGDDE